jgi:hypothetical protein
MSNLLLMCVCLVIVLVQIHELADAGHLDQARTLRLYSLVVRKAPAIVDMYQAYGEHRNEEIVLRQLVELSEVPEADSPQRPATGGGGGAAAQSAPVPAVVAGTLGPKPTFSMQKTVSVQTADLEDMEAGNGGEESEEVQQRWEVGSHNTVDSDDSLVTPRHGGRHHHGHHTALPQTRQELASALSAKARVYLPHAAGQSPAAASALKQATKAHSDLTALVNAMHLNGELSPGDAEVATQLIKQHNPYDSPPPFFFFVFESPRFRISLPSTFHSFPLLMNHCSHVFVFVCF